MARYLTDTNVLLRLSDTPSSHNALAASAVARLFREHHEVFITAQNLIEFWAVATRPLDANGLGWDAKRSLAELNAIREKFPLISDSPEILNQWLRLVEELPIVGKRVHDARLVAVMKANAIDHLLTFNSSDFAVFPSLSVVEPSALAQTTT